MSLHRYDAKRDAAEPAIVSALEALGCVVWRVSGKGLPDLIVLRAGKKWLADVKGPKEKATPAQEEAWEEAATKARCAVFILRTPKDAQKMLNNALQPWEPEATGSIRAPRPHADVRRARRPRKVEFNAAMDALVPERRNYTPPRSTPVDAATRVRGLGSEMMVEMLKPPGEENYDAALKRAMGAAKEAGATFAAADDEHRPCAYPGCTKRVIGSDTCMEHDP